LPGQLDAMDDHFDQKISDPEFLRRAGLTRDCLDPSAGRDPGLAVVVRALGDFLGAAEGDLLLSGLYDDLRSALADLEEPG
jgi:hypothetical protein